MSCPSSPLFIPAKPEKKSGRRTRKNIKEGGGGSTDSEDRDLAGIKETSKKKQQVKLTNQKDSKGKKAGNKREDGQDSRDSEVLRESTVAENCEDQVSSVRQRQRATCNVTVLQTEQPRLKKTSKVRGERCGAGFIPVREDEKIEGGLSASGETDDLQSICTYVFHILWGKENGKEQQCFFSKIHCRMRKH